MVNRLKSELSKTAAPDKSDFSYLLVWLGTCWQCEIQCSRGEGFRRRWYVFCCRHEHFLYCLVPMVAS